MTNSMKRKLRRLVDAINGALSESEDIHASLAGVREEGYDLHLVLEASLVRNLKKDEDDDDLDDDEDFDFDEDEDEDLDDDLGDFEDEDEDFEDEDDDEEGEDPPLEFRVASKRRKGLRFSACDIEFLRALNIRCD